MPPRVRDVARPVSRPIDPRLTEALLGQNTGPARDAVAHIAQGAPTVVTGQQVGLFGGPLYTLYKIWTALRWAKALSIHWNEPVVPVFWVQEEDHDVQEVAWFGCRDENEVPYRFRLDSAPGRTSLAHRALPVECESAVSVLPRRLASTVFADELCSVVREAYAPGRSWSDAFVRLLVWIFDGTPLVILRPRCPEVAALAAPVHREVLNRHSALLASLQERSAAIERAGFAVQVPIRDHTLSFIHPEGANGPRFRLIPNGQRAYLTPDGTRLSADRISGWLTDDPLRFSSSALLRPAIQDTLLNTAGYVAGPGEASYFGQIEPLYRHLGLRMPMLLPRARFRILEPWAVRLLRRWSCEPKDAEGSFDDLLAQMCGSVPSNAAERRVREELVLIRQDALTRLRRATADLPLEGPTAALERKLERDLDRFESKLGRICRRMDDDRLAAARRLWMTFCPEGLPQERFFGLAYYLAQMGRAGLIQAMDACWKPGTLETQDLTS